MRPWIGVGLDGTLAHADGWHGEDHVGAPVALMVERVKHWIADGIDVRIFTPRAHSELGTRVVEEWCEKHLGQRLPVTAVVDYALWYLYDTRCIPVIANTGVLSSDAITRAAIA